MDELKAALEWHRSGKGAALATVVETWGSAPRPVGSQLAVSGESEIEGSVSGGCVEGAVVVEALDALADGAPRLLTYGVSDDEAFAVGLACGGTIRILVEPIGEGLGEGMLAHMIDRIDEQEPIGYAVDTVTWERGLIGEESYPERWRADRSGFEGETFVLLRNPPLRMAIVGGVHIAQALVPMARMAGFAPYLIDPRDAFASAERFPGVPLTNDWPDAALGEWGIDARAAVVTLTHDPKIDDPALRSALASEAFYIGALGSRRTHAKRLDRLGAEGFDEGALARIHAPVGLDIGARSPAEIAVSVLAEVIARLRRP